MDFLGIGPLELVFILVIALIVLGPRDIARFARSAGRVLNRIYRSDAWGAINKASREFRDLPNRLAREAALDDLDQTIRQAGKVTEDTTDDKSGSLEAWQPSQKSIDDEKPAADDQETSSQQETKEADTPADTSPPPNNDQGE